MREMLIVISTPVVHVTAVPKIQKQAIGEVSAA